jgi:hypothetical protein
MLLRVSSLLYSDGTNDAASGFSDWRLRIGREMFSSFIGGLILQVEEGNNKWKTNNAM